jgi:hypothetical protein
LQQHAVLLFRWLLAIRLLSMRHLSSGSRSILLWKLLRCHSSGRTQLAANGQRLLLLKLRSVICCTLLLLPL